MLRNQRILDKNRIITISSVFEEIYVAFAPCVSKPRLVELLAFRSQILVLPISFGSNADLLFDRVVAESVASYISVKSLQGVPASHNLVKRQSPNALTEANLTPRASLSRFSSLVGRSSRLFKDTVCAAVS